MSEIDINIILIILVALTSEGVSREDSIFESLRMSGLFERDFSPSPRPPMKLLNHKLLHFQFIPCYLKVSKPCQGDEIPYAIFVLGCATLWSPYRPFLEILTKK